VLIRNYVFNPNRGTELTGISRPQLWHRRRSIGGGGTSDEGVQDQGTTTLSRAFSGGLLRLNVMRKYRNLSCVNGSSVENKPCGVSRVAEWLDHNNYLEGVDRIVQL
jgi:hypothetical protein